MAVALAALIVWFVASGNGAGSAPVESGVPAEYGFRVVRSYPHDPESYTQGLLYRDGAIYESTGQYGRSKLRKLDLETGEPLHQIDLANQRFGEGLAYAAGALYQLTWHSGIAFVYDSETFALRRQFRYRGEGWGLAYDGRQLIMSDGSGTLRFRDPNTFEVARELKVEGASMLNELEYIDGEIWANVYETFTVLRISPETGAILGRVNFRGILTPEDRNGKEDVFNGIAYDAASGRIFVTGKYYSRLYEVELVPRR